EFEASDFRFHIFLRATSVTPRSTPASPGARVAREDVAPDDRTARTGRGPVESESHQERRRASGRPAYARATPAGNARFRGRRHVRTPGRAARLESPGASRRGGGSPISRP